MTTDKEKFSNWLKRKIKIESVMKGKDLAREIGRSPSTISGWFGEGKSQGPEKDIARKICLVLSKKTGETFLYEDIIKEKHNNISESNSRSHAEMVNSLLKQIKNLEQQVIDLREFKDRLLKENDELKQKKLEGPPRARGNGQTLSPANTNKIAL